MTNDSALEALAICRRRIDSIDRQILELLTQRTEVVAEIGEIKQAANLPIHAPHREDEVFGNVAAASRGPLPKESVRRIFTAIIEESRKVQGSRRD